MKKSLFKAILLGLCLCPMLCPAQKPLQVGDTIPDELWRLPLQVINHPQGKNEITLSDYKDKLIILDFWATTCPPCIKSLLKLDSLEKFYSNTISMLPVTRESKAKVEPFFAKRKIGLNSVVDNNMLQKYFPHRYIPHCVWIQNGIIISITDHKQLTTKNFDSILLNQNNKIPEKKDHLTFDATKPIFSDENGVDQSLIIAKSTFSRHIEGLSRTHSILIDKLGKEYARIFAVNSSIAELYGLTDPEIAKLPANRIHLNGTSSDLIFRQINSTDNLFCYEYSCTPKSADKIRKLMKSDLDNFFHFNTFWKKQLADCYILTMEKIPHTTGAAPYANIYDVSDEKIKIINSNINTLAAYLNNNIAVPVIDETGYTGKIDIELPNLSNIPLEEVIEALRKQGMILTKGQREINFFTINAKNQ